MPLLNIGEVVGQCELRDGGPGLAQQGLTGGPGLPRAGPDERPSGRLAERDPGSVEGERLRGERLVDGELEDAGEQFQVCDGTRKQSEGIGSHGILRQPFP